MISVPGARKAATKWPRDAKPAGGKSVENVTSSRIRRRKLLGQRKIVCSKFQLIATANEELWPACLTSWCRLSHCARSPYKRAHLSSSSGIHAASPYNGPKINYKFEMVWMSLVFSVCRRRISQQLNNNGNSTPKLRTSCTECRAIMFLLACAINMCGVWHLNRLANDGIPFRTQTMGELHLNACGCR